MSAYFTLSGLGKLEAFSSVTWIGIAGITVSATSARKDDSLSVVEFATVKATFGADT